MCFYNTYKSEMPIEKTIEFPQLQIEVDYVIGKNASENFEIIDNAEDYHIWFHAKDNPSSHVIAKLEDDLKKKELRYIIKQGAILCKQHSKLTNQKNVDIIYTQIKNITKTDIPGSVYTQNEKTITI